VSRIDAALVAFLITLIFMFALRPVANAIGLVDRPGGRKVHVGIVPVIGGVAMYLGLLFVLPLVDPPAKGLTAFLLAAGLLVLVGAIDDRFDIPPRVRLLAQATAALILCLGGGLVVESLGNLLFFGEIRLGVFAVPFTVLVTISVINAFNMLDGMDGLAGSISFASLLSAAFAAAIFGGGVGLTIAMVSMAVVLAFLVFNFPTRWNRPVRAFMGDGGSTLLGFIVVWLGLRLAHGEAPVISPVTALWIAALPIFDLFISFGRRLRKGQSPLQADREHFHHILLRAGLSERQILSVMVGSGLLVGVGGIIAHRTGVPDGALFLALVMMGYLQYLTIRRAWKLARWIRRRRRTFRVGPSQGVD
jgi:UDP-GlcNAc:undecaprenyl-phosphate/decaprenyl-phosphate GlcNAc-1-phosphate transferase